MRRHKYKVGQTIRYFQTTTSTVGRPGETRVSSERYEITRLLPEAGAEFQYRIKGVTMGQERVVRESEIA